MTGYAKTEAGQAEIRQRSHALARHARTLLVLVDGSRSGEQLLAMVQGASEEDLDALVAAGLIAELASPRGSRSAAPAPAPAPPDTRPGTDAAPADAEAELGYAELYDSLNALSKEQLGLFKGYRFALEIEKASGIEGLREVALKLVDEVQKAKGDSAAQMVRRALGIRR